MFAELPVGLEDPVERLHSLHEQMQDLKESGQAVGRGSRAGAAVQQSGSAAIGHRRRTDGLLGAISRMEIDSSKRVSPWRR
jgi:hypothetical protein